MKYHFTATTKRQITDNITMEVEGASLVLAIASARGALKSFPDGHAFGEVSRMYVDKRENSPAEIVSLKEQHPAEAKNV